MNVPVHICFLMDCTGSMQTWIHAARDQIQMIIDQTQQLHPNTDFRVGFVGYRDYGDEVQHIVLPFTTDIDQLRREIGAIRADGGNDCAEDVAGGLERAVVLFNGITQGVRQVIHIADAPAHGNMYHDVIVSDRFPHGDPNGRNPEQLIHRLGSLGIEYTIVRVDRSVDTMIEVFHNSYTSDNGTFRVLDLIQQGNIRRRRRFHDEDTISDASSTELLSPNISLHLTQSIARYTASQDPGEV